VLSSNTATIKPTVGGDENKVFKNALNCKDENFVLRASKLLCGYLIMTSVKNKVTNQNKIQKFKFLRGRLKRESMTVTHYFIKHNISWLKKSKLTHPALV